MAVPKLSDLTLADRREFASADDEAAFKAAVEGMTEDAKENYHDPAWQREQARIVAERLDWGFVHQSTFNSYFPTRRVRRDEQIVLEERRGLKVFYTHRAGEIDESQLRTEQYQLQKDTLGWHVREFEDNVEMGYGPFITTLVPLARQKEEAEVNRRILSTLRTAVGPGSPSYVSGAFSEQVLRDAVTDVEDVPQPSNARLTNGTSIVGRRRALQRILDFDSWNDNTADSIARTGVLGTYFGANVVSIPNYADEDGVEFIADDEIWVIGGNVGLFAAYGGPKVSTWHENKVPYWHYQSRRDIGVTVTHPEVTRRIVLDGGSSS